MDHLVQSPSRAHASHATMGPPPPAVREKKPLVPPRKTSMEPELYGDIDKRDTVHDKVKDLETRLANVGNAGDLNFLFTLMADIKRLQVERVDLLHRVDDEKKKFLELQEDQKVQIEQRENKLKELIAAAYLDLPEDRQAALQYYLEREGRGIDVLTTLRVAQIEIARMKASEDARKAPAPEGQVVLVFTDVQDSTALWDHNPDVMTVALDIHNRLMRLYITRFHGYEVKTEGDAFMIAFSDPSDAVLWCLEVQQSLILSDWPEELIENPSACVEREPDSQRVIYAGLRVRMGVHVGNPMCSKDPNTARMDYFGPDVNRAARVSGAAHGGQIIVSDEIMQLISADLREKLDDPLISPLGSHKMKGLKDETILYSMVPRTLSGRKFDPPKTVTTSLLQMEATHKEKDLFLDSDFFHREPPLGRVFIVILCIQGGRVFWEENPSDMAKAFQIHGRLLKTGLKRYNGYAVKAEGDKTLVAFDDPKRALDFVAWVQVTFTEEHWPPVLDDFPHSSRVHGEDGSLLFAGLRMAIGLHYGEPICRPNPTTGRMDYTGGVVNLTARLVAAASGGQTILSADVENAFLATGQWEDLENAVVTEPLGTHHLHGIRNPAKLVQLLPEKLAQRKFPPIKTLSVASLMRKSEDNSHPAKDLENAPRNDVTFVSTGVENLDSLWETLPAETREALNLYSELMRTSVLAYNGYEVKSADGQFVCAFHSAKDASQFAMTVQKQLLDVKWPYALRELPFTGDEFDAAGNKLQAGLRVAMGIHTGDPVSTVNQQTATMEYYGNDIPTVNAIGAAAHGGQILMDKASYSAVVTDVKAIGSPSIQALGVHELPGVHAPEHLTQILPRSLAARTFPQPHTLTVAELARNEFRAEATTATETALQKQAQDMRTAPWGDVFIIMLDLPEAEDLWLADPQGMLVASRLYCKAVRTAMRSQKGYEVSSRENFFLMVFQRPKQAFSFCLELDRALVETAWPSSLLAVKQAAKVYDPDGEVVLSGPRTRVSVHYGKPTRSLDPVTRRDVFIGRAIEIGSRMLKAARPGQILLDRPARIHITNTLKKMLPEDVAVKALGEHRLSNLAEPLHLFLFAAAAFSQREYAELATATNALDEAQKQKKELEVQLSALEEEEKAARYEADLSKVASLQAKSSILKEQKADLVSTIETIHSQTTGLTETDDSDLQAVVARHKDPVDILASSKNLDKVNADIDDLAALSGTDLSMASQIKLLRAEAKLFERNLHNATARTDQQQQDMLDRALRHLFRRLGLLYNLSPALKQSLANLKESVDFLASLTINENVMRNQLRQRGGRAPDLESLDASQIDEFKAHIERMLVAGGGGTGSVRERRGKPEKGSRRRRLSSAPGKRDEHFAAAQNMMSLVQQTTHAVHSKFPARARRSRPTSRTRSFQDRSSSHITSHIDLAEVSRQASRNRLSEYSASVISDDESSLSEAITVNYQFLNTSNKGKEGRGKSGKLRGRQRGRRGSVDSAPGNVTRAMSFRARSTADSDSEGASRHSLNSVASGSNSTTGVIVTGMSSSLHAKRRSKSGQKQDKNNRINSLPQKRNNKKPMRLKSGKRRKKPQNPIGRSASAVLASVRESTVEHPPVEGADGDQPRRPAPTSLRLGKGVALGGSFDLPEIRRRSTTIDGTMNMDEGEQPSSVEQGGGGSLSLKTGAHGGEGDNSTTRTNFTATSPKVAGSAATDSSFGSRRSLSLTLFDDSTTKDDGTDKSPVFFAKDDTAILNTSQEAPAIEPATDGPAQTDDLAVSYPIRVHPATSHVSAKSSAPGLERLDDDDLSDDLSSDSLQHSPARVDVEDEDDKDLEAIDEMIARPHYDTIHEDRVGTGPVKVTVSPAKQRHRDKSPRAGRGRAQNGGMSSAEMILSAVRSVLSDSEGLRRLSHEGDESDSMSVSSSGSDHRRRRRRRHRGDHRHHDDQSSNDSEWDFSDQSDDSSSEVWVTKGVRLDHVQLEPFVQRGFQLRKIYVGLRFEYLYVKLFKNAIADDVMRVFDGVKTLPSKLTVFKKGYNNFRRAQLDRRLAHIRAALDALAREQGELRRGTMQALNLLMPGFANDFEGSGKGHATEPNHSTFNRFWDTDSGQDGRGLLSIQSTRIGSKQQLLGAGGVPVDKSPSYSHLLDSPEARRASGNVTRSRSERHGMNISGNLESAPSHTPRHVQQGSSQSQQQVGGSGGFTFGSSPHAVTPSVVGIGSMDSRGQPMTRGEFHGAVPAKRSPSTHSVNQSSSGSLLPADGPLSSATRDQREFDSSGSTATHRSDRRMSAANTSQGLQSSGTAPPGALGATANELRLSDSHMASPSSGTDPTTPQGFTPSRGRRGSGTQGDVSLSPAIGPNAPLFPSRSRAEPMNKGMTASTSLRSLKHGAVKSPRPPANVADGASPRRAQVRAQPGSVKVMSTAEIKEKRTPPTPRVSKVRRGLAMGGNAALKATPGLIDDSVRGSKSQL